MLCDNPARSKANADLDALLRVIAAYRYRGDGHLRRRAAALHAEGWRGSPGGHHAGCAKCLRLKPPRRGFRAAHHVLGMSRPRKRAADFIMMTHDVAAGPRVH